MPKHIAVRFSRVDASFTATLEYSFVPEGLRRFISLAPGQTAAARIDQIPDDLRPSHVQVYCLDNNHTLSTTNWQFPPGPPSPHGELVVAVITILDPQAQAVGTVIHADGSATSDSAVLDRRPGHCREG